MKVALIGLGKMGMEMAQHLLQAGHELTVYNRTVEKALLVSSAKLASTPAQAVADADVVLTILLDDAAVEQVTFGADGILESLPRGAVHVSLSTISLPLAKRLEAKHKQCHHGYVSAPVIGRPEAAREAKLIVVAGGSSASIAKVQPLFNVIGRATFNAGREGWQANLFKLCCNFMISGMIEAFGEAQALIRKAGSSPEEFVALMAEFWGSPIYRNYGALIAKGQYDPPGATLAVGVKDNGLLLDAGKSFSVPLPLATLVREQMLSAVAAGNAELDWASLTDTAARNANLPPQRS